MTISSSLNAGVAGLSVNATRLATISDNISNSATYGYKRSQVDFSSLVLQQRENAYAAGGVKVQTYKDAGDTGSLVATGNATDIAIAGRGLLPVTDIGGRDALPADRELQLLPTGSFSADEEGFLRTLSGLHLLGWPIQSDGTVGNVSRDSSVGLEPVNVSVNQFTASPTTEINLGLNLPASATDAGSPGDPVSLPTEYFDNIGRSQTLTLNFTPVVPATGSSNAWSVSILDSATDPTTPIATFDVTFDDTPAHGGSISTLTPGAGMTYDATSGVVAINVASGPIDLFIGRPNDNAGLTQLSAPFSPNAVSKNGAPIGDLRSVEIDSQGFLEAVYDTGFRRQLYKIPVADVPNMNGLTALDNQAYTVSQSSGDVYFWDPGEGPVGTTAGFALMESTTDVAQELTDLIETQRAYSSNAKIVQTVDEMLQETTNIKR
jgi:flagellar hook protein FlgE